VSRVVAQLQATPERVFAVLADPYSYADWIVGSDAIRDADATWPTPGSRFHHRIGIGPLKVDDHTEVLESIPPHRLVLKASARPLGTAKVTFELAERDGGTRLTLTEEPGDLLSRLLHNPIADCLLARRNAETLRRLGRLAGGEPRA
jgi:uncharacterized protein YndB with AHSA1/START domain